MYLLNLVIVLWQNNMLLLQLASSIFPAIIFFKELHKLVNSLPIISCQLTFAKIQVLNTWGPKQRSNTLDIVILIYFVLDEEGTECSATLARKVTVIYLRNDFEMGNIP